MGIDNDKQILYTYIVMMTNGGNKMQQTLIQIRVDRPLKDEVAEIFTSLGLDMSTAVRIFFQRCKRMKGIPFALTLADVKPKVKVGISKGKWKFPKDWEEQDKILDKKIEADFYANTP